MRVLLIGGSGQLGTEIRRGWTDWSVAAPTHADLDLENLEQVEYAIDEVQPDVVVNCAAFHNVDTCEVEQERAFAINAIAVGRVARACRDRRARFVTVSTDYVFDGTASKPYTEKDVPDPISAYGTSKLAGEYLVTSLQSDALVVRTCGVYGVRPSATKGYTFVDKVIANARAGQKLRIVSDSFASPTFAGHLAAGIRALLEANASGLHHVANVGPVSWYDFACEALAQAGVPYPIEPISVHDWKAGARRPVFSALDSPKLRALGFEMPGWREGIAAYLRLSRLSQPVQSP